MGKFTVKIAKNGEPFFDLKAVNGEIIGKSEMYTTMEHCLHGIESVKHNALSHIQDNTVAEPAHYPVPKYEIFLGHDEQFYFHLKAGNGEIILASEGYTAKESCLKGIHSVGVNAPEAPIVHEEAN